MIRTVPLSAIKVGTRHRKDKSVARVPLAPLTPADLAEAAGPRNTAPASIIGAVLDLLQGFEADA